MNIDQPMYTTNELAVLLGMRPQSLINRRYRGSGPKWIRVGERAIRYRREDIEAFLKESNK